MARKSRVKKGQAEASASGTPDSEQGSAGPLDSGEALLAQEIAALIDTEYRVASLQMILLDVATRAQRRPLLAGLVRSTLLAEDLRRIRDRAQWQGQAPEQPALEAIESQAEALLDQDDPEGAEALPAGWAALLSRVAHLTLASYGSAAAHARSLGDRDAARTLHRATDSQRRIAHMWDRVIQLLAEGELPDLPHGVEPILASLLKERNSQMERNRYRDAYDDDDRGNGQSRGGRESSRMQERDEYGQFAGYDGGRSRSGRYDGGDGDYDGRGGSDGRSRGGYRSSHMQERDEYGQFAGYSGSRGGGYGGGGRSRDDNDGYNGSGRYQSRDGWERQQEGRSRGGYTSSHEQDRDEYGQFTGFSGSRGGGRYSSRGGGYDNDDRGGSSGGGYGGRYGSSRGDGYPQDRYDSDDQDSYSGRSRGGRGRYSDDERDIVDSAGRHYTRESWERAQEGRALGGQHSHGGGRPSR